MFSFQKKKSKKRAKKKADEAPGPVQLSKVCSPSNRWPFAEKNAVPFKNEPENSIFMILFWLLIYSDSTPCSQGNSSLNVIITSFLVVRFQEGVQIAIEDFAHVDSSSGFYTHPPRKYPRDARGKIIHDRRKTWALFPRIDLRPITIWITLIWGLALSSFLIYPYFKTLFEESKKNYRLAEIKLKLCLGDFRI